MSHYHFDIWKSDRELFNAALATIQVGLGAAEAESAWAEGEAMTLDQAIDYAVDYAEGLLL
jgi:hypothetical protein